MKPIVIREYDYLISGTGGTGKRNARTAETIPRSAYEYLSRLISRDESRDQKENHHFFLKWKSWNGKPALQVQSFVGVLQTPCGTQIEILPKTAIASIDNESDDTGKSEQMLVRMLRRLRDAQFKPGGAAELKHEKMNLLEVFIAYFLQEVNSLVKKGIRSDYVVREENQPFLKGKLLIRQQIRVNAVQQQRFFVAYDEYLPDRPENRLIHRALEKVSRMSRSAANQRLGRELMCMFDNVPVSRDIRKDFSQCSFNRGMLHYRIALKWCRMILNEESSVPSAGSTETISILFRMEKIFEGYVGWLLGRSNGVTNLRQQVCSKFLLENPRRFQMKPDYKFNFSGGEIIGDAKWKLIDYSSDKYGVSQSDLYQLYAYGQKYLSGSGRMMLFYPKTDCFKEYQTWNYDDKLELMLVPVPLPYGDNNKVGTQWLNGSISES